MRHDAIRRRCLYHWVDYPDARRERLILARKAPQVRGPQETGPPEPAPAPTQ